MPRMTVDLSDDAFEAVEEIAGELSTTKSEALRKALALMRFAVQERKKGGKLVIEDPKENVKKEIVQL